MRAVLKLFINFSLSVCFSNRLKMPFYAVARGRAPGIFMSWGDCEAQVKGFSGARYKKFDSIESAQNFISIEGSKPPTTKTKPPSGSYKPPSGSYKPTSGSYKPTNNNNSLKRSYSTTSQNAQKYNNGSSFNTSSNSPENSYEDYDDSDNSDEFDDLNTVVMKQIEDIEKRVQNFEKGVEKIVKQSSKGSGSSLKGQKQAIMLPPQPKKRKSSSNDQFEVDSDGFVQVYTDGACSSNGRSGARAGFGVYWGEDHHLNASKPVSGRATNNCGEIQAATHAIKQAAKNGVTKLQINTDSQFLINSVTKWIPGWKQKGWKLRTGEPVKNEKDFKELDSVQKKVNVKWNYVEAHKGIHGNEMADQLAKAGAAKYK